MINIYTDGSFRGNNEGGFGVIIIYNNTIIYQHQEQSYNSTNNREELKAILHAIKLAYDKFLEEDCIIYTDSMYCVNICNNWIYSWARNGWFNSYNNTVKNLDLIQKLYYYLTMDISNIKVAYCHGHIGIIENELVHALANNDLLSFNKIRKENGIYTMKELDFIK